MPLTERGPLRWLAVLALTQLLTAGLWLLQRALGLRSFAFAFNLHFLLMFWAANVDLLLVPKLDSPRFVVSAREVELYRRLGVVAFMRLLQRIGWTATMIDKQVFDGTRATLASYEQATRHGENSHAWLLRIVLVPTAWAVAHGWWDAAFWMSSMSVAFHVYPILLQRTQSARLARLLGRAVVGVT